MLKRENCMILGFIFVFYYNLNLIKYKYKLKDKILVYTCLLGVIGTSISYFLKQFYLFELFHIKYAFLMILIPLISNNKEVLTYHFINGIIAIITRKIYNGCLLHKVQKERIINPPINWNILFPTLTLISLIKLNI